MRLGLVKLADACFADVCLHPSGMRRGEAFALFALPVHYQFKLDIRQDRLSLRALDEEWLGDWLAAHPAELAYVRLHGEYVLPPFGAHPDHELGDRVVLTAPTEQVQKFLRENAANERAWSEHSMVLERIEPTRAGEESPGIKP